LEKIKEKQKKKLVDLNLDEKGDEKEANGGIELDINILDKK
jgi:hypothetical protein